MSFDVELFEVTKRFGDSTAVGGISFNVESGSFFSLLGPSGCGKSTTLRMLGGFEHPDSGTIRINGSDMAGVEPYRRPTNVVFQRLALFPHMTVEQNIAFGLQADGRPRDEVRKRVGEALELVSLQGLAARKPAQISGGQMQRVALARALVKRPKVLLLDEPLSALDLKLRHQMQFELKRIQQEVGMTFIFVTHDQGEALNMSDRVGVMNLGRLEQVATPQELYDNPATPFIARFVGNSNAIGVDVLQTDGNTATVRLRDKIFDCRVIEKPAGQKGRILIRWERVVIGPAASGLRFHAVGTIRDVVFSGASIQYVIAVDGGGQDILAERSHHGTDTILSRGSQVEFGWDEGAARLIGHGQDE